MKHLIDKICECKFCTMIDCMWADPLLSVWEHKFVNSVARAGWLYEYTKKQKSKISEVFNRMRNLRGINLNHTRTK